MGQPRHVERQWDRAWDASGSLVIDRRREVLETPKGYLPNPSPPASYGGGSFKAGCLAVIAIPCLFGLACLGWAGAAYLFPHSFIAPLAGFAAPLWLLGYVSGDDS